MSIKFTKKQLKKIIKEELQKSLETFDLREDATYAANRKREKAERRENLTKAWRAWQGQLEGLENSVTIEDMVKKYNQKAKKDNRATIAVGGNIAQSMQGGLDAWKSQVLKSPELWKEIFASFLYDDNPKNDDNYDMVEFTAVFKRTSDRISDQKEGFGGSFGMGGDIDMFDGNTKSTLQGAVDYAVKKAALAIKDKFLAWKEANKYILAPGRKPEDAAATSAGPVASEDPFSDELLNILGLPPEEQIPALEAFITQLASTAPENPNLPTAQAALEALQQGDPAAAAAALDQVVSAPAAPTTQAASAGGAGASAAPRRNAKARRVDLAHKTIKAATPEESVKTFQKRLIKLGYSVGNLNADGDYGGGTLKGVRAFQKKNGLKPDGVVGPNTWGALKSSKAKTGTGPEGADPKTGKGGMKVVAGDSIISKLRSLDFSTNEGYEKLRRVYIKTRMAFQSSNNMSGVPKPRAQNAAMQALEPYPADTTRDLEDSAELMLVRLNSLMRKGWKVKDGEIDIDFDAPMMRSMVKRVMEEEGLMQESKSYDLDFGKWSKLWK